MGALSQLAKLVREPRRCSAGLCLSPDDTVWVALLSRLIHRIKCPEAVPVVVLAVVVLLLVVLGGVRLLVLPRSLGGVRLQVSPRSRRRSTLQVLLLVLVQLALLLDSDLGFGFRSKMAGRDCLLTSEEMLVFVVALWDAKYPGTSGCINDRDDA